MPRRIVPPPPIKILFIGGTGRCGTTWTRRVIAAHRDVFDVPVECNMRDHLISGYIERAKADGYRWMAEKSPSNALCAREILRRYKDSRYLHVSRERSAVIASTMRAGRYDLPRIYASVGGGRPYTEAEAAAYVDWIEAVGSAVVAEHPDRAMHVMVEELCLPTIWRWLGLDPRHYSKDAIEGAPRNSTRPGGPAEAEPPGLVNPRYSV